jgi:NAD(P)-dependent dehydrogenase (short-subunit alcohol dehydrogenase family)
MAVRELKNKWVLVSGAASGIGYETALAFARQGANVVVTDVNAAGLEAVQRDVDAVGVRCLSYAVDVSDEAAMREMAEAVHKQIGALDVLVNNAGIGYLGPFLQTSAQNWRRVFDVNVMGIVHACQAFLPAMIAAGGARHVVNVASAAGISPAPNLSAYSASKHAVMGLSDTLSIELDKTQVGVTVVCPGVINTPIIRNRSAVSAVIPPEQLDCLEAHYRKTGAHPSLVARQIVRGVKRGQDIVLAGPTAQAMFNVKRLSRWLARKATILGCKQNGYLWPTTLPAPVTADVSGDQSSSRRA